MKDAETDLLTGLGAIAGHLGWTTRQTKHRVAHGELPTFTLGAGRTIYARRSTLARHFAALEAAAGAAALMADVDQPSAAAAAFARQRAAMAVNTITGPEKAVLLVLAIMANGAGEAWPTVRGSAGLAARCSLGERTVVRALRGLEEAGHISTRQIVGKGSIYTVQPCRAAPKQPGTTSRRLERVGASEAFPMPAGSIRRTGGTSWRTGTASDC